MRQAYAIAVILCLFSVQAHAGIFDNTPFDPKTWRDAIKNTPFDPQTWVDAVDDLRPDHIGGTACEKYADMLKARSKITLAT